MFENASRAIIRLAKYGLALLPFFHFGYSKNVNMWKQNTQKALPTTNNNNMLVIKST